MIHLHTSSHVEHLAAHLATVLNGDPPDPMTPEWVAVPSDGMRRWLPLQLARHLGLSEAGAGDGVAANFSFPFPGSLRAALLNAERDLAAADPWQVDRLVWVVLDAIVRLREEPKVAALGDLPPGASLYGRARRIADMFDRYHLHRPDMVRAWSAGEDTDAVGRRLPDHHAWQPHLWRQVRRAITEPSPPERLPGLLERLVEGELDLGLPPRLSVFGLTVLPGGRSFLQLSRAVAVHRDVHLYLLEPSPLWDDLAALRSPTPWGNGCSLRSDDLSARVVRHPLLQSWGRLQRESSLLIVGAHGAGYPHATQVRTPTPTDSRQCVLSQLQSDIRENVPPSGSVRTGSTDPSVRFHACHGPTRQVEVLRDAILHLLSDEDLDLSEDDVLVVCPALDRFAPLVEAVFGPSADSSADGEEGGTSDESVERAPALRYRIADRSVRGFNAVLSATADLIELIGGRFEASAVLDFLSLAPVRARARFDDDQLAQIGEWIGDANVRWGLDPHHRSSFGVPATFTTNTWRAALDRLLLGSAVSDGPLGLALGETAVIGVEGADVVTVGRLVAVLERLAALAEATTRARSITDWVDLLRASARDLFDVPADLQWQLAALWVLLDDVSQSVPDGPGLGEALLEFADLRRVFGDRLDATPGRPDFFRGGVTVSSLTPLRGIPYRVVCLLGMDESAFSAGATDGDDLAALQPALGDPDPRAEDRLSLLELVMAAGDRLLLLRDGYDVRTNQKVPPAVIVDELREALAGTVRAEDRPGFLEALETVHPRQAFDESCFVRGRLIEDGVWGFDGGDLAGAQARRRRPFESPAFLRQPLHRDVENPIALSTLHRFLQNPVKMFVEQRLGVRLPRRQESVNDRLPVAPGGLQKWQVGQRLLDCVLEGVPPDDWARVERRLGTVPPAWLGESFISEIEQSVARLVGEAMASGWQRAAAVDHPIDVDLGHGLRIVGSVPGHLAAPDCGPARIMFTRGKPVHRVAAWLDLMALMAMDPTRSCRSLVVARGPGSGAGVWTANLVPRSDVDGGDAALEALRVIVRCFEQGSTEPIPLFPSLSYRSYLGQATPNDWTGSHGGRADGDDPATGLVFGGLDFRSLMALEVEPGDPVTAGGRVAAFAHYLYGAMEASVEDMAASPSKRRR